MMLYISQKNIFICGLILLFLGGAAELSYAALTMEEVRYLFEKEKGGRWENATSEEKKDFLGYIRWREEEIKKEEKASDKKGDVDKAQRTPFFERYEKNKAQFNIRTSFEKEVGVEWEDGEEKEKKRFLRRYKVGEKKWKQEEKIWNRNEKRREKRIARELRLKKQEIKRKRLKRAREEKLKLGELQRKRKEEERALMLQRRKEEEFRRKFKDKRNRQRQR